MLSLIGAATSEPPMPSPFLTLIATCRPVWLGDFSIGAMLIGVLARRGQGTRIAQAVVAVASRRAGGTD